jgi:hypothetical protein
VHLHVPVNFSFRVVHISLETGPDGHSCGPICQSIVPGPHAAKDKLLKEINRKTTDKNMARISILL